MLVAMDENEIKRVDDPHAAELSCNQVQSLVRAMESIDVGVAPVGTARGDGCEQSEVSCADDDGLIKAILAIHESAADLMAQSLSMLMKTSVQFGSVSVKPLPGSAACAARERFSWLSILEPNPLAQSWVLSVPPGLSFVFVDRMLGGDPTAGEAFDRTMTSLERNLMLPVIQAVMDSIQKAWKPIEDILWSANHVSTDAIEPTYGSSSEVILAVSFEVGLCKNSGLIRLDIPLSSLASVRPKLSEGNVVGLTPAEPLARNIASAPVDISVSVAKSTIKTSDLLGLSVGDVIASETSTNAPLEMMIHRVPKFKVQVGSHQGRKAVQIVESIE